MKNRFIVKPVKIVWRNSMIAGNPISRSFKKFGVYDRNWQNDGYCFCPNPGGSFVQNWQARKYRLVLDEEDKAKRIADKLNELSVNCLNAIGGDKCEIEFGVMTNGCINALRSFISDEDIDNIVITKSRS